MQPYKLVVVSEDVDTRARLADAMLGGNADRVLAAPVNVVFAADTQPMLGMPEILAMEARAGRSSRYLRSLPFDAGVMTAGVGGGAAQCAKATAMGLASRLLPLPLLPTVSSAEAWAFKNASLAAQTLMLAAAAHGLGSHTMEGLDARGVRAACGIPSRFAIPFVISLGYEARGEGEVEGGGVRGPRRSPRLPPESMVMHNRFGQPLEGVPVL